MYKSKYLLIVTRAMQTIIQKMQDLMIQKGFRFFKKTEATLFHKSDVHPLKLIRYNKEIQKVNTQFFKNNLKIRLNWRSHVLN